MEGAATDQNQHGDAQQNLQSHPALRNPQAWEYYNEGNNNIILRYSGKDNLELSERLLRIRKSTNFDFYTDPCLLAEDEYNELLIFHVFRKDAILKKYLQETIYVKLEHQFLKCLDERLRSRNLNKIVRSESAIDFKAPLAMLVTNFSSFFEMDDDPESMNVISFEIKPKSGVTEYLPLVVKDYINKNKEALEIFFGKGNGQIAEKFMKERFSKFHVMQVSRKFKGKLDKLSEYSPFDFFNLEDSGTLERAIMNVMKDGDGYGRLFINGEEERDVSDEQVKMIAHFLKESEVISAVFKYQKFSSQCLEYIASLYSEVLPELQDPGRKEHHFDIIRQILSSFSFSETKALANTPLSNPKDFVHLWTIIMGYMITATAKDFTIVIRIVEPKQGSQDCFGTLPSIKAHIQHERIMEYKGKQYKVRIGVIDLEAKLYTKLPLYIKEVNEAYLNFVKYHNQEDKESQRM